MEMQGYSIERKIGMVSGNFKLNSVAITCPAREPSLLH